MRTALPNLLFNCSPPARPPSHPPFFSPLDQVADEIRKVLGRNITVHTGLSVGVAWTSVKISHEPPDPPTEEEEKKAAPAAAEAEAEAEAKPPPTSSSSPSSSSTKKTDVGTIPGTVSEIVPPDTGTSPDAPPSPDSPGSVGTGAATVPAGRRQTTSKKQTPNSPGDGIGNPGPAGDIRQRRRGESRDKETKKKKQQKKKRRGRRRDGGSGGGDQGCRGSGESGSEANKAGEKGRRKRRRRDQRRPRSAGVLSRRQHVRRRRGGKGRGRSLTNDRSSGEEVTGRALTTFWRTGYRGWCACFSYSTRLAQSPTS